MLNKFFRPKLIIGSLPVTLTNGTTADATQVMSDLNYVVNQVNANAAPLASPTFTGTATFANITASTLAVTGTSTLAAVNASGLITATTAGINVATTALGNCYSGAVYTPVITNTTNVAASTAHPTTWVRVGDSVMVFGNCEIDPTSTALVVFNMALPVASNLTAASDLGGSGANYNNANHAVRIIGNATSNDAEFAFDATDAGNQTVSFSFGYTVK